MPTPEPTQNQIVAKNILDQLGGRQFKAMTGAKVYAIDGGVQVHLPSRFAKNDINRVEILENKDDLYDMKFMKISGAQVTTVVEYADVFCEALQSVFKDTTGLDTSMGRIFLSR